MLYYVKCIYTEIHIDADISVEYQLEDHEESYRSWELLLI